MLNYLFLPSNQVTASYKSLSALGNLFFNLLKLICVAVNEAHRFSRQLTQILPEFDDTSKSKKAYTSI